SVLPERLELLFELLDPRVQALDLVLELLPGKEVRDDGLHSLVDLRLPVLPRLLRLLDEAWLGGGRGRRRRRRSVVLRSRGAARVRRLALAAAHRNEATDRTLAEIGEDLLRALVDQILERL